MKIAQTPLAYYSIFDEGTELVHGPFFCPDFKTLRVTVINDDSGECTIAVYWFLNPVFENFQGYIEVDLTIPNNDQATFYLPIQAPYVFFQSGTGFNYTLIAIPGDYAEVPAP